MPINTHYTGTVYDIGEAIPHYVTEIYTPHVWFDKSKRYKTFDNIFEHLMVSEGMLLGDSEDDMWTVEEILEEVLKYVNLHIVQHGFDYYIFDWETSRTDTQIQWIDIFTGDTKTENFSVVNVAVSNYASDDTQLTMADVYNEVAVKDDITEMEDVIFSPFDDDQLIDITYPQKYMTEYCAAGTGKDAWHTFYDMVRTGAIPDTNYGKGSSAYKKTWMMKLKKAQYWDFLKNGIDVYTNVDVDGQGKYYNAWKLPKYIFEHTFTAAIFSFGAGEEYNKDNTQNIENITKYDDYLCINIGGNGSDEGSTKAKDDYQISANVPAMFPTPNDIKNSGLEIRYNYTTDGTYSPADSSVHNYLVFSGKIIMTVAQQCTGYYGFEYLFPGIRYGAEKLNELTAQANSSNRGGNYCDWAIFPRQTNNFIQYSSWDSDWEEQAWLTSGRVVPTNKQDDGAYYGLLFYDDAYPTNNANENRSLINLMPPMDRGDLAKRFKYDLSSKSYYAHDGGNDIISYVDILTCQIQIGDKFCEEYYTERQEGGVTYRYKNFRWVTAQELMDRPYGEGYEVDPNTGQPIYKAYVYLAINIDNGQFLLGQEHDIYNNIDTNMGLSDVKDGMAVPLPAEDNLSGELKFSILGPVNISWDQGIRRHPTWFSHTQYTANEVSVLPHVAQIWIKKFNVELVSDKGKNVEYPDADIVYRSDEQRTYLNKKDDIDFKFTTSLTAEEAAEMKVNYTMNRSDVADDEGQQVLEITDTHTNETDKPEKIYVDAYYREYCEPRTILETTVHDGANVKPFNKYNISFMNKAYYFIGEEKNLARGTTKLKLKEIF